MVSTFNKEKVFWTKSMNIDLVKYMEDKPFIWNTKDPQFTNLGLRDETFANFVAKYNNEFSWTAAKDRWTNIRSTYGFYMRKIMAKKAKGEDFKVNWFLWQPCKYLKKVYKFTDKKEKSIKATKKDKSKGSQNQEYSHDENSNDMEADTDTVTCDNVADNLITVFKGVQNNAFVMEDSQIAEVGQAVTKTMSQLNSFDAAQLAIRILEILAKYDDRNPMNPNNV